MFCLSLMLFLITNFPLFGRLERCLRLGTKYLLIIYCCPALNVPWLFCLTCSVKYICKAGTLLNNMEDSINDVKRLLIPLSAQVSRVYMWAWGNWNSFIVNKELSLAEVTHALIVTGKKKNGRCLRLELNWRINSISIMLYACWDLSSSPRFLVFVSENLHLSTLIASNSSHH